MPTNNIRLFDENKTNMLTDADYRTNAQRLNGVQSGVASSQLQNKTLYQTSLVSYAIAQFMNEMGFDASDSGAVSTFVNNLSSSIKKPADSDVKYVSQSLTDAQKTQARENIAAGSAADLAKKPNALLVDITLHVAKTGNDTTGDGSESKPYLTIQKALNSLPKLLLARADIVIHGGTYEEAVLVYGFSGVNSLTIEGAENETVKIKTVDIRAVNLAEAVQLRNVELVGTSEDGYNFSVKTVDTEFVVLENVSCTNAVASSYWGAFRFSYTTLARLTGCTISNKAVALDVAAAVVYMNNTVTGTGNTVGIRCGSGWGNVGGYVQKGGATIAGEEQKGFGGQIW